MRDLKPVNPRLHAIRANLISTYPIATKNALNSYSPDSLEISFGSPQDGSYHIKADWVERVITVISPVSGRNTYAFVASGGTVEGEFEGLMKGNWLSTVDSHDLVGMLTRDMLRSCAGCLNV
jgi:hypothetical protein